MKKAKKLYKDNKSSKELKSEYKKAKKRYLEASESEEKKNETNINKDSTTNSSLQSKMEKAKEEWKSNRSDKKLREAYLMAKKAFETGDENPTKVCKIFCANVSETIDDEKIQNHFEDCGTVIDT